MRAGATIILVGFVAVAAYSMGRQDAPLASRSPAAAPVALVGVPPATSPTIAPAPRPSSSPAAKADPTPVPSPKPELKRKAEIVLTAAAIAALIIKASRDRYYATGHPCACPDDLMRNGRSCGARSAYSRPGGAAPLCYPTDVSEAMIENYKKAAARE